MVDEIGDQVKVDAGDMICTDEMLTNTSVDLVLSDFSSQLLDGGICDATVAVADENNNDDSLNYDLSCNNVTRTTENVSSLQVFFLQRF